MPGEKFGPNPFDGADKAVHASLFFIGAILLATALRGLLSWRWKWLAAAALGIMTGFALSDEFHQLYTPHRSGMDPGDLAADILGSSLGILCVWFLHGKYRKNPHHGASLADRAA